MVRPKHDVSHVRVVLENFLASWCGPRVKELPGMQRLQDAMTYKPFTLFAVNVEDSSDAPPR